MSQKNMSRIMSQIIIVYKIEELLSDIQFMNKEVADIEKSIKKKKNALNIIVDHFGSDSARSDTASVLPGRQGSYDVSEERKYQRKSYTDIEKMEKKVADLRINIKKKENDLRTVMKKDWELKFNSVMKPIKYIEDTVNIRNDPYNINDLNSSINTIKIAYAAARRASSSKSSSASGSSSSKSSSAARRASPPAAKRAARTRVRRLI